MSRLAHWVFVVVMLFVSSRAFRVGSALRKLTSDAGLRRTSMGRSSVTGTGLGAGEGEGYMVTTPIYYVNGQPHLGHAYTSVVADIICRFNRNDGKDVFFLTGTDEHGQKVEQSAVANNKTPLEFADAVSGDFRALAKLLNCSNDDFIRTTEERHKAGVAALWKRLEDKGHIYLGAYEGWYSIRDEAYYAESELVDGKAPTGADVQWVKEESYFFRLSAFTKPLLDLYERDPDLVGPKGRRNEVVAFVGQEGGLQDLSISRTTFSWGVPVPGNPKHVVYVWLDALANYITAVGYPDMTKPQYNKYWPAALHIVGKDILRFHAVFWPAFLMAAELPLPKRIFAHGWWTKDGEKMSKSVGNVVDPLALISKYGLDYVRYFFVSEVPFGQDGDFSDEAFALRVNSDLANDVGNLAQRCLTMVAKNCDGCIPGPGGPLNAEDEAMLAAANQALGIARKHVGTQNMKAMCESIIVVAKQGNKYIDVQAPWNLLKTDTARFHSVLYVLADTLRTIAVLLEPVTPAASSEMLNQLGVEPELRTFASLSQRLPAGTRIGQVRPVFPKIEREESTLKKESAAPGGNSKAPASTPSVPSAVVYKGVQIAGMNEGQCREAIEDVGAGIRAMKAAKASKQSISAAVAELNALKARFQGVTGSPWEAPAKA